MAIDGYTIQVNLSDVKEVIRLLRINSNNLNQYAKKANESGYETAMRFTKGNHAFIAATHTDRAHIYNHIIFNSTNLSCDRKFRNSWFIALVLQKVSDIVCLEHALSVIIPRKISERDNHNKYHRVSFRSVAHTKIDELISSSHNNYEEFLRLLAASRYEIKSGKHISIRGAGQKKFIRLKSLGQGYAEEEIRKRILGKHERKKLELSFT